MELSDYWHLIRRWGLLVVAGTVLASAVGYALPHLQSHGSRPLYDGTATVIVNYAEPSGLPYNPDISPRTDTLALAQQANSAAALTAVAARYHVGAPVVRQVSATVNPNINYVVVHVTGTDATTVEVFATGMAHYLANRENQRVAGEVAGLRKTLKPREMAAYRSWFAAQQHYYLVCGCLGSATQPSVSNKELAALKTRLDLLLAAYQSAADSYQAVTENPLPPAASTPGTVTLVQAKHTSAIKTLLPAALLGLILSIGLAALLDYLRTASRPVIPWLGWSRGRSTPLRSRVPVLGSIKEAHVKLTRGERRDLESEPQVRRRLLEELGTAGGPVAAVLDRLAGSGRRSFYVTSPGRREAKTQTALSLAVALAQQGRRAVLIDADPAGGGLSSFVGFERSPGLSEYLAYPAMSLRQLLQSIDVASDEDRGSLRFLPLGLRPDTLSQQAGTRPRLGARDDDAWGQALDDLIADANVVVINGAPTRESTAALALARKAAGTVLVARRRFVSDALSEASEVLQTMGARLVGVVINADEHSLKLFPALEGQSRQAAAAQAEPNSAHRENAG